MWQGDFEAKMIAQALIKTDKHHNPVDRQRLTLELALTDDVAAGLPAGKTLVKQLRAGSLSSVKLRQWAGMFRLKMKPAAGDGLGIEGAEVLGATASSRVQKDESACACSIKVDVEFARTPLSWSFTGERYGQDLTVSFEKLQVEMFAKGDDDESNGATPPKKRSKPADEERQTTAPGA